MKAFKIFDAPYTQIYHISKPSKEFKNKYKLSSIVISYLPTMKSIITKNVDKLLDPIVLNGFAYIFTTKDKKDVFNELRIKKAPDASIFEDYINNKKCGMNGVNQDIFNKNDNVVLSVMSVQNEIYPPSYLEGETDILTNIKELEKLTPKHLQNSINKAIKSKTKHIDNLLEFIQYLSDEFPINYGGSLRRFSDTIDESSFKKSSQKNDLKYYIGYDIRYSDSMEENDLNKLMEKLSDWDERKKDNFIYVYETYNNPMNEIIKQCENKKIKYKIMFNHCIKINENDYDKLKLISHMSDYV